MIEIQNLCFTYPGVSQPALRGVSLHVPAGEQCLVMGPSGAGKSTLLRCLNERAPLQKRRLETLSGGERQRLAIAAADDRHAVIDLLDLTYVGGEEDGGTIAASVSDQLQYLV